MSFYYLPCKVGNKIIFYNLVEYVLEIVEELFRRDDLKNKDVMRDDIIPYNV